MKFNKSEYTYKTLEKSLSKSIDIIKRGHKRLTDEDYKHLLQSLERRTARYKAENVYDEDEYQESLKLLKDRYENDPSEDELNKSLSDAKKDFENAFEFLDAKLNIEIEKIEKLLIDHNIECWIGASINDERLIHEFEESNIHFVIFFKNDNSNITISYSYNEDGKREILDELEVFGGDWDEDDSELETSYADILDILRRNKPIKPYITLYRHMSYSEHDKWISGEIIPKGKYFTSLHSAAFAPDDERFNDGELMRFSVDRKLVAQTSENVYQLIKPAKFIGNKIISVNISESKFNTLYYNLI